MTYIDEVAVERACKGDRTVFLTPDEAEVAFRYLNGRGTPASEIGALLGVSERAVTRWRSGANRPQMDGRSRR